MTPSLRMRVVEAMAKTYFYEVGRRSGSTLAFETAYDSEQADFKYVAGLALDAIVDYLTENREEWITGAEGSHDAVKVIRGAQASNLLEELRESP